jgi:polysaccharide biosynthesis/export protein
MNCPRPALHAFLLAAAMSAMACPAHGKYVWVEDLAANAEGPEEYVIRAGDALLVRVWNQEGMNAKVKVREDGNITVPLLNDVMAAGKTPNALATQLAGRLKEFFVTPVVTVSLEEPRPLTVSIVGEVARQGVYTLEPGSGLLNALATAGGLNDYAHLDGIYVIRGKPELRIRFRYDALTREQGRASRFRLQPGDVIYVE